MRFSAATSLAVAAAAAPSLVAATGPFATLGFSLGTKNSGGSCKSITDYEQDFDAIKQNSGSTVVRGYSTSDCDFAKNVLPAAQNKGFKVVLGIWPDTDDAYKKDVDAISGSISGFEEQVYAITVGSETLYRGNFTGDVLWGKINEVKTQFPQFKVGTADSWNKFRDGTADPIVQKGVDILLINAFAFWQGQDISNATATYFDDMMQAMQRVQSAAGDKFDDIEIWNGETGWPTDGGSNYQSAIAGTDNAKSYYRDAVCGIISLGYNAFYFEAFDEPWKPDSIGDNGLPANEQHWGAMNADRSTKFDLKC